MRRRTLLTGTGLTLTTLFAGCSDNSEAMEGGTRTTNEGQGNGTNTQNASSEQNTNKSEDGSGDTDGEANPEIVDHELGVDEGGFMTEVYVEATVENTGDAPSGEAALQADWYDAEGNYLDNDSERLETLGAGETWSARVYLLGSGAEEVNEYELGGEFETEPYESPEHLTVVDSAMDVRGDELVVEGEVENGGDETEDYVEAIVKVYNEDGEVLGDEWANVTELRAGETWAFTLEHFTQAIRARIDEAADHEVIVTTSAF